jgi:hypothetical protein
MIIRSCYNTGNLNWARPKPGYNGLLFLVSVPRPVSSTSVRPNYSMVIPYALRSPTETGALSRTARKQGGIQSARESVLMDL